MAYQDLARRFKFLIAGYKRHGIGHVREVFRQARVRAAYAKSPPPLPSKQSFVEKFGRFDSDRSFLDAFYRAAANRIPITQASRKEFFVDMLLSSESYDHILEGAELISEGRFPALGICINEASGTFDWHRDYSSGHVYPSNVPFNKVSYDAGNGSDVKYAWELSRMYWIGWLAKAYWISNNGTWSQTFVRLIDDWSASNPVNTGVNWSMPMEVGIRAFWLMMGYGMFYKAPNITDAWWVDYLRKAYAHGTYLQNNLEYFSNLTNHYIANCFGLMSVGSLFAGSNDGQTWFHNGRARMIEELDHQVLPDGVHYERSIGYHRLVLEMYGVAVSLAERAGSPFPADAIAKINLMAGFVSDYTPNGGIAHAIGDMDDGVILRLNFDDDVNDHRATLSLAAAVLHRDDLQASAGAYSQAAMLIAGSASMERARSKVVAPARASQLYRDGGFAVLTHGDLHVTCKVGPIGLHGNNDVLSFALNVASQSVFLDPGTYCYTGQPDIRNELRSTRAHNAPMIDESEIAEFDGLWRVRQDRSDTQIVSWAADSMNTNLIAEHYAYGTLARGAIVVSRRWNLDSSQLSIVDKLNGIGTHNVKVRFTIPDNIVVERNSAKSLSLTLRDGRRSIFECSHELTIRDGWFSPSYGVGAAARYIEVEEEISAPCEIQYLYSLD